MGWAFAASASSVFSASVRRSRRLARRSSRAAARAARGEDEGGASSRVRSTTLRGGPDASASASVFVPRERVGLCGPRHSFGSRGGGPVHDDGPGPVRLDMAAALPDASAG